MNKSLYAILPLGLSLAAACGAGNGTVTTSMMGERSAAAHAPVLVLSAAGGNGNNSGATADEAVTGSVSAVNLQVSRIVAHRSDAAGGNASEGSEKDGTNGWVVLSGAKEIELMKAATDANAAVLGTADMPAGNYTQIRLYLKDTGNIIVVNGTSLPLTIPSGALKLVGNATVAADKKYKLVINLDLDHSLVINNQGYKLKPTVKYSLTEK